MARPRSEAKKDFPPNLNRNNAGYYSYRDRETNKCRGLGKDKEAAFRYAERMNDLLGIGNKTEVVDGLIGFGNTLTAEYVLGMAKPIKRMCGIYILMQEREIVYVGQSINCQSRIGTHLNDPLKVLDSHFVIECQEKHLDHLEARYIIKFRPKYNLMIPKVNNEIAKLFAMLDMAPSAETCADTSGSATQSMTCRMVLNEPTSQRWKPTTAQTRPNSGPSAQLFCGNVCWVMRPSTSPLF